MSKYGAGANVKETTAPQIMNAGINENVILSDVKFEPLTEGNDPTLQVEFQDPAANKLNEVLWPVNEEQVKDWNRSGNERTHNRDNPVHGFTKGEVITPEDAVIIAYDDFNRKIKHIATKFVSKEVVEEELGTASSYADLANKFVALLKPKTNGQKVRLKVVLSSKDYAQLPKWPPFIESMDVDKQQSNLEINPKYDKVEKSTPTSAEDQKAVEDLDQASF